MLPILFVPLDFCFLQYQQASGPLIDPIEKLLASFGDNELVQRGRLAFALDFTYTESMQLEQVLPDDGRNNYHSNWVSEQDSISEVKLACIPWKSVRGKDRMLSLLS